jgi:hypothetical protein
MPHLFATFLSTRSCEPNTPSNNVAKAVYSPRLEFATNASAEPAANINRVKVNFFLKFIRRYPRQATALYGVGTLALFVKVFVHISPTEALPDVLVYGDHSFIHEKSSPKAAVNKTMFLFPTYYNSTP